MKQFKLFRILFYFSLSFLFLAACDEEEEDPVPQPSLTGRWELSTIEWRNADTLNGFYNPLWIGLISREYVFRENNEFEEINHFSFGVTGKFLGEWTLNDDNTELSLEFDNGDDETYDLTLGLNTMIIERDETYNLSSNPEVPLNVTINAQYEYVKLFDEVDEEE